MREEAVASCARHCTGVLWEERREIIKVGVECQSPSWVADSKCFQNTIKDKKP
jgi:hypothetical protein